MLRAEGAEGDGRSVGPGGVSVLSRTPSLKGCDPSAHTGMQVAGVPRVSSPHSHPSALDHQSPRQHEHFPSFWRPLHPALTQNQGGCGHHTQQTEMMIPGAARFCHSSPFPDQSPRAWGEVHLPKSVSWGRAWPRGQGGRQIPPTPGPWHKAAPPGRKCSPGSHGLFTWGGGGE